MVLKIVSETIQTNQLWRDVLDLIAICGELKTARITNCISAKIERTTRSFVNCPRKAGRTVSLLLFTVNS